MTRRMLFLMLLLLANSYCLAMPVVGTFTAQEACPAYISKNKKTNPGNVLLEIGVVYPLKEINRDQRPDWFRVVMPQDNGLRWVHQQCGTADYQDTNPKSCDFHPGMADSYVLAMSWMPAFCQTYGYEAGRPECLNIASGSYESNHMVLHGLWPNQQLCGERYGFCGVKPKVNHCDYPLVDLNEGIAIELQQFMPSYAAGSCLERHEWNKHGSCQFLSSNDYFSLAVRLAKEINNSALAEVLKTHTGKTVSREQLAIAVSQSFGDNNIKKFHFSCKDGYLVDILVNLPALIPEQEPLASLIEQAPVSHHSGGCPDIIQISNFHP